MDVACHKWVRAPLALHPLGSARQAGEPVQQRHRNTAMGGTWLAERGNGAGTRAAELGGGVRRQGAAGAQRSLSLPRNSSWRF